LTDQKTIDNLLNKPILLDHTSQEFINNIGEQSISELEKKKTSALKSDIQEANAHKTRIRSSREEIASISNPAKRVSDG